MPSGIPLVHPHPILVVEHGGTSMAPASVRDRLSLTRKEKLWCQVCLHPHLEHGGMPPVEKWSWSLFFPLLQMGANNSSLTPLNCILKNWDRLDPQGLRRHTWSSYVILHGRGTHWRMANGGQLEGLLSIILFYN